MFVCALAKCEHKGKLDTALGESCRASNCCMRLGIEVAVDAEVDHAIVHRLQVRKAGLLGVSDCLWRAHCYSPVRIKVFKRTFFILARTQIHYFTTIIVGTSLCPSWRAQVSRI
jgi:hypothetical protein